MIKKIGEFFLWILICIIAIAIFTGCTIFIESITEHSYCSRCDMYNSKSYAYCPRCGDELIVVKGYVKE